MTTRMSELEHKFMLAAFHAQCVAIYTVGADRLDDIQREFGVSYERTGYSLEIFIRQWEQQLGWNPETCPF